MTKFNSRNKIKKIIERRGSENRSALFRKATRTIFLSILVACGGSCAEKTPAQPTNLPPKTQTNELAALPTLTIYPSIAPQRAPSSTSEPPPILVAAQTLRSNVTTIFEQETTPRTYNKNLYDNALVRYQDPDMTACVAASTEMMLNLISAKGDTGTGFKWEPTDSYAVQEQILAWDRAHDTLIATHPGTDANGWRNGLNEYGWDTYSNPNEMVYNAEAFDSYDLAVKAAIMAIARYDKPVGILGWAGGHAQFMNGYEVKGENPAVSSDFTVEDIYLTDPLAEDGLRNVRISNADFESGALAYRFTAYEYTDSPYEDPYTHGTIASYRNWYDKWVIVAPVR